MKKRAVTLLLCLVLVVLSLLRGFAASAAGIIPAEAAAPETTELPTEAQTEPEANTNE